MKQTLMMKDKVASMSREDLIAMYEQKVAEHFQRINHEPTPREFEDYLTRTCRLHGIELREKESVTPHTVHEEVFE